MKRWKLRKEKGGSFLHRAGKLNTHSHTHHKKRRELAFDGVVVEKKEGLELCMILFDGGVFAQNGLGPWLLGGLLGAVDAWGIVYINI